MNTKQHEQIEADLKAFLDGELPFLRRQVVASHIKNCPQCRQEIEFMQTIEKELETVEVQPLDSELRSQILDAVPPKVEPKAINQPAIKTKKSAHYFEYGMAVAGVAFIALVGLTLTGKKISNTFNAASSQINTSTSDGSENYRSNGAFGAGAAPPSAAPSSGVRDQIQNEVRIPASNGTSFYSSAGKAEGGSYVPTQRAVHREGNLTVAVDNAEAASAAVENIVKNTSGFIANNALSTGPDGKRSATMDLRIPVAQFANVVEKISKLGKVSAKSISGEDITAKVAKAGAVKSTLSNELSIREAQLRQKEKSARKSDANALYYLRQDVRSLRIQASEARAQLETLQKFATLSNLYVTLQDKEKPVAPVGWTNDINQTGHSAWSSFQSAAKLPIQLIIWILAYSPLWLPALIIWKKFGKKWIES